MRRYSLRNEVRKEKKKRGYKSITSSTLSTFNKPWLDLAGVNEGNTYGNTEIENQGAGKYSPFFEIYTVYWSATKHTPWDKCKQKWTINDL